MMEQAKIIKKKAFIIGAGAAGNKVLNRCLVTGVILPEDCCAINSTEKDLPVDFPGRFFSIKDESVERGGCGKEPETAAKYTKSALKSGSLPIEGILDGGEYDNVIIIFSLEGGSGNGSARVLTQYVRSVMRLPVHLICIAGYQNDTRGLRNTFNFFKSIPTDVAVSIVNNSSYLTPGKNDYLAAEMRANDDIALKVSILIGNCLQYNDCNIDDTDIFKLTQTPGYSIIEYMDMRGITLKGSEDYDRIIHEMIAKSSAMETKPTKFSICGIIANLPEKEQSYITVNHPDLLENYNVLGGSFYENYNHLEDVDETKLPRFIAFIVAGLPMPKDKLSDIYDKYEELVTAEAEEDDGWSAFGDMNDLGESSSKLTLGKPKKLNKKDLDARKADFFKDDDDDADDDDDENDHEEGFEMEKHY